MSRIFDKLYYAIWNIGFIEQPAAIVAQAKSFPDVHWLKHNYKNRFFADPFILSVDDNIIECLVEDYPFYDKRGYISKLIIDRKSWQLLDRKPLIVTNYHQSFPYIHRMDGKIYIIPEGSASGQLICWELVDEKVVNPKVLIDEPLLDATFFQSAEDLWWCFCTKRCQGANDELHIFYSNAFDGKYREISINPAKVNISSSRPAGYTLVIDGKLHRITQNSTRCYGEGMCLTFVQDLTKDSFFEIEINKIYPIEGSEYPIALHTMNDMNGITVVDGLRNVFMPIRRFAYECINLFMSKRNRIY